MVRSTTSFDSVTPPGSDRAKPSLETRQFHPSRWVVLAPEIFRHQGGISRVSRHYLQVVSELSDPVPLDLIVLNDAEAPANELARYAATHARLHLCNRSKWACWKAVWRATQTPGAHVVCTQVYLSPLLWIARKLGRSLSYEILLHGVEVWKPLSWSLQMALQGARHVFSVSRYTKDYVGSRYPKIGAKIIVLPNALDPQFAATLLEQNNEPNQSPTILAVSRMAAHDVTKGIDHLIEAMPAIRRAIPDATLRIVGDGADRARLESLARLNEASASISFLGAVDDTRLQEDIQECRVFALPSAKEGFGLVYLEAMASGRPCIVAQAGGAPEVIDEHSGIAVPYGDVAELANATIRALTTIWNPARIKARAQHFSYAAFAERWRKLVLNSA